MFIGIDALLLKNFMSGVERTVADLAASLLTYGREDYTLFLNQGASWHAPEGRKVTEVRCRFPAYSRLTRILYEQFRLEALVRKYGVELLHAPAYVGPVRCNSVPCVVTVHDTLAFTAPELCRRTNVYHFRAVLPHVVRNARAIITPSVHVRDQLAALFPHTEEKIRVIPWGINEAFFAPSSLRPPHIKETLNLPARFLLFVGQDDSKKNIDNLLKGFQQFRQTSPEAETYALVLTGPGLEKSRRIRTILHELGLEDNVILTGSVSVEQLRALYEAGSILLFPSMEEGFGLPPLEAMACGLPVITSRKGALPEVCGDGALFLDTPNSEAIAEAISDLLQDDKGYRELQEKGKTRAADFSWQKTAEETERLYRECVK